MIPPGRLGGGERDERDGLLERRIIVIVRRNVNEAVEDNEDEPENGVAGEREGRIRGREENHDSGKQGRGEQPFTARILSIASKKRDEAEHSKHDDDEMAANKTRGLRDAAYVWTGKAPKNGPCRDGVVADQDTTRHRRWQTLHGQSSASALSPTIMELRARSAIETIT